MRATRAGIFRSMLLVLAGCAASAGGAAAQSAPRVPGADTPLEGGDAPGVSRDALRAAVEANVGVASMGPARVERTYRWRPLVTRELLVWVTCRGSGDSRACAVSVGSAGATGVRALATEPSGWSPAQLTEGSGREQLFIVGTDGRGNWRQQMRFGEENGGTISFGRRTYDDGM